MHGRPVRRVMNGLGILIAVTGMLLGAAAVTAPASAAIGTAAAGPQHKADRAVARPPADVKVARNAVAAAAKNKVLAGQNGNLSIITPQGDLLMYYHHGWQEGTAGISQAYDRGDGWNAFAHVVSYGVNNTYDNLYLAVTHDGRMYGYYWSHYWQYWVNPSGTYLGSGWENTSKLIPAGNSQDDSILYRITNDGKLWWYMYNGVPGQGGWWSRSGIGSHIGTGWGSYRHVAATGGMFYAVRSDGILDFFYYPSMDSGEPGWYNNGNPEQIGSGWSGGNCGFQTVQGGGHSMSGTVVYTVDGSGRLRWFAHVQDHNGHHWTPVGNCGATVGTGWM
jgi:hypothetical protein